VFASSRAADDKALIERVLAAYRRATRDYHDVLLASVKDGEAARTPQSEPLLASIATYTGAAPEKVAIGLSFIDRDGKLDVPSGAGWLRWYRAQVFVDKGVSLAGGTDRRYVAK